MTGPATYVLGSPNTNVECPSDATPVDNSAECGAAASALGNMWQGGTSNSAMPHGCVQGGKGVYFNSHTPGSPSADYYPVCKQSTISSQSSNGAFKIGDEVIVGGEDHACITWFL